MAERVFQSPIEHMKANIQEPLDRMPVPSHLLFRDMEPIQDVVSLWRSLLMNSPQTSMAIGKITSAAIFGGREIWGVGFPARAA
jgi:hypothetical protein